VSVSWVCGYECVFMCVRVEGCPLSGGGGGGGLTVFFVC
jgi:hypothetical protein